MVGGKMALFSIATSVCWPHASADKVKVEAECWAFSFEKTPFGKIICVDKYPHGTDSGTFSPEALEAAREEAARVFSMTSGQREEQKRLNQPVGLGSWALLQEMLKGRRQWPANSNAKLR